MSITGSIIVAVVIFIIGLVILFGMNWLMNRDAPSKKEHPDRRE